MPAVFNLIKEKGKVDEREMYRTFNNGIGLVVVFTTEQVHSIMNYLDMIGEKVYHIGKIVSYKNKEGEERVTFV